MIGVEHQQLEDVERRVCDIAAVQLGIARRRISPGQRIVEDLNCDSLDLVELFMEVEQSFGITFPEIAPNAAYKAVFTRQPFRLADLAEMAYLQQGTNTPDRKEWRREKEKPPASPSVPFTQLGGHGSRGPAVKPRSSSRSHRRITTAGSPMA